jgi:hypothetical protein
MHPDPIPSDLYHNSYRNVAFLCASVYHYRHPHLKPAYTDTCLPTGPYLPVNLTGSSRLVAAPWLNPCVPWVKSFHSGSLLSAPGESLAVSMRLLRRTQASQNSRSKIAAPPTTAPTPMPAFAPVDRPLEGEGGTMVPCVGWCV